MSLYRVRLMSTRSSGFWKGVFGKNSSCAATCVSCDWGDSVAIDGGVPEGSRPYDSTLVSDDGADITRGAVVDNAVSFSARYCGQIIIFKDLP